MRQSLEAIETLSKSKPIRAALYLVGLIIPWVITWNDGLASHSDVVALQESVVTLEGKNTDHGREIAQCKVDVALARGDVIKVVEDERLSEIEMYRTLLLIHVTKNVGVIEDRYDEGIRKGDKPREAFQKALRWGRVSGR